MKAIVLVCLVVAAYGLPQGFNENRNNFQQDQQSLSPQRQRDREAQILSFTNERTQDGGNVNSFSADNGLQREEKITLREVERIDEDGEIVRALVPFVEGFYRYTADNGDIIERRYYTDETGIHYEADDLPKAPQL